MSSQSLKNSLEALKEKRRKGEIGVPEFYKELLSITASLVKDLQDEDISEEDIKKQIPLVLAFLEDQIDKLESRGH
jgi:hypothetical protein